MSWKMLGLALAAGLVFATAEGRAMPLTHELKAAVSDDVITVADGCGRGWRWSHSRGACVPMGRRGPVVVDPGAVAIGTAAAVTLGVVGTRHYHRRHHRHRY